MNLTLELSPEVESQLRQVIARRDTAAARRLLANALAPIVEALLRQPAAPPSGAELRAMLDRLVSEAGKDVPVLSEKAISRASIYREIPVSSSCRSPN